MGYRPDSATGYMCVSYCVHTSKNDAGRCVVVGARIVFNCKYVYIPFNYELQVLPTFAIRLTNINVHIYYSMVWDRPSQLSDSHWPDLDEIQTLNQAIKTVLQ